MQPVAVAAAQAAPRVNVGWLIFAALLADVLLGVFVLAGVEHVREWSMYMFLRISPPDITRPSRFLTLMDSCRLRCGAGCGRGGVGLIRGLPFPSGGP